jgi:hypothetical protein
MAGITLMVGANSNHGFLLGYCHGRSLLLTSVESQPWQEFAPATIMDMGLRIVNRLKLIF